MRDAIGGAFSIQLIIVFIVVIISFLGFSVNYNRTFHFKNHVVDLIERNEGLTNNNHPMCMELNLIANRVGYLPPRNFNSIGCPSGFVPGPCSSDRNGHPLFCVRTTHVQPSGINQGDNLGLPRRQYDVIVFVNIDIPVLNQIFPRLDIFRVPGSTRTIIDRGNR